MNPLFNAVMGGMPQQQMAGPVGPFQNVIDRARQIAQSFQNPQQFISQFMPGIPSNIANDPNQILNWLQQTGRISPQQIQAAQQIAGMFR